MPLEARENAPMQRIASRKTDVFGSIGCPTILLAVILTPVALLLLLFCISHELGQIGLSLVISVLLAYALLGYALYRSRDKCPSCDLKSLKVINSFRVNPPPHFSLHRCDQCNAEYGRIGDSKNLIPRAESTYGSEEDWIFDEYNPDR